MTIHLSHGCRVEFLVVWIPRFLHCIFNRRANSDWRPAPLKTQRIRWTKTQCFELKLNLLMAYNAVWWKWDISKERERRRTMQAIRPWGSAVGFGRSFCSVGTPPRRWSPGGAGPRAPAWPGLPLPSRRLFWKGSLGVTKLDGNISGPLGLEWIFRERDRSGESGCYFLGWGSWSEGSPVCHCWAALLPGSCALWETWER